MTNGFHPKKQATEKATGATAARRKEKPADKENRSRKSDKSSRK